MEGEDYQVRLYTLNLIHCVTHLPIHTYTFTHRERQTHTYIRTHIHREITHNINKSI